MFDEKLLNSAAFERPSEGAQEASEETASTSSWLFSSVQWCFSLLLQIIYGAPTHNKVLQGEDEQELDFGTFSSEPRSRKWQAFAHSWNAVRPHFCSPFVTTLAPPISTWQPLSEECWVPVRARCRRSVIRYAIMIFSQTQSFMT